MTALAAAALAQQPDAMPIVVNSAPAGAQTRSAVVSDPSGALLVAWQDSVGNSTGIKIQGFDRLGHRSDKVYQAMGDTYLGLSAAELSANMNGRAVLSWQADLGAINRIFYRKLNMDGSPVTEILPLVGLRDILGDDPSSAIDSIGNVMLVWTAQNEGTDKDIIGNYFAFRDTIGSPNQDTLVYGWTGNMTINESTGGQQDSPSVASDRNGRVLVAWRDLRADSLGIFCRAYSSRGKAVGSFRLNTSTPGEIAELGAPVVAAAGLDYDYSTFLISWVERDTLGSVQLRIAKVDLALYLVPVPAVDTLFQQKVRIRDGLAFERPALDANEDGLLSLAWSEVDAGVSQVYSVIFLHSDAILPPPVRLTSTEPGFGAPALFPSVDVGDEGGVSLVWSDQSGDDPDLRLQRYNSQGVVESPVFASPGSGNGDNRAVTFLGQAGGGYTMFWEYESSDTLRIYNISYDIAGRPLAPPQPFNQSTASQRRPVAAENSSGLQALAWEEYSGGSYRVMLTLGKLGGNVLREPFAVASSSTGHLGSIEVAVSDSGRVALLWERWNSLSGAPDLMLARLDSLGNVQGSQITVAPASGGGGREAAVAAAPNGNWMVTWRQGASNGDNAQIAARVYSAAGSVVRNTIAVSSDTVEYLGSTSRPVVAASDSTGNFLVIWQEFFSTRNLLYYRLYDSSGNSLQLPGGLLSERLGSAEALSDLDRAYNSAAVEVDSSGGFMAVWSEVDPTGEAGLYGVRFDPHAQKIGSEFQVPGVSTATLPVVRILDQRRVAIAWQDTSGTQISFLGVQLDFHTLLGRVLLASDGISAAELTVHAEGAMTDAVPAAADGSFRFPGLLGGRYRVWISAGGEEIPGSLTEITISAKDRAEVDMGVAADLRAVTGPALPRAGSISLAQNIPNPFNPSTTVSFTLGGDSPGRVTLAVYDLRGALVRTLLDAAVEPGVHRLEWDGRDSRGRQASSGVYFLRLTSGGESRVRKMILLK